jgi:general secretion pathway protein M
MNPPALAAGSLFREADIVIRRLRALPAVQKTVAQYDQLPARDQKALALMAVALLLGLLYFAVWRPVNAFHQEAVANHERARALVAWMEDNRAAIRGLAENRGDAPAAGRINGSRALMSTVTSSANSAGITLQRFEPSGDDAIRLWLEDVPFSQLAAWLEGLTSEQGLLIDQASLDRSDKPGRVSARLTLKIRS